MKILRVNTDTLSLSFAWTSGIGKFFIFSLLILWLACGWAVAWKDISNTISIEMGRGIHFFVFVSFLAGCGRSKEKNLYINFQEGFLLTFGRK
jgi:hypothetical protein